VLCVETSGASGGWALFRDGERRAGELMQLGPKHSLALAGRLSRGLEEAGVGVGDLAFIGIGVGPGSYTGMRVGAALVSGMAYAADVPLVGVCSLVAWYERGWAVLVDARAGGVYGYKGEVPSKMPVEAVAAYLDGVEGVVTPHRELIEPKVGGVCPVVERAPDLEALYRAAAERVRQGEICSGEELALHYHGHPVVR
jgi:tRNA threonylcarbamoyladenosine biosynthesis protein TsaB